LYGNQEEALMGNLNRNLLSRITKRSRIRVDRSPILTFKTVDEQDDPMKPKGLWYAIGMEWMDWCDLEGENDWLYNRYVHKITTDPQHILMIRSKKDFWMLKEKYKHSTPSYCGSYYEISWKRIAKDYAGIEISPYQWKYRLDVNFDWYYSWDVASGCIWNEKAIKKITPLNIQLTDNFFS
jgi:hypothetical protein